MFSRVMLADLFAWRIPWYGSARPRALRTAVRLLAHVVIGSTALMTSAARGRVILVGLSAGRFP